MNINYNNVCGDYIGATGIYSISDYIDNTSNVIESHLLVTSNILNTNSSNYTSNTSNYIVNRYDQLIKKEVEEITIPIPATLYHTYIYNSNIAGEIRFWCKSTSSFPIVIPVGVPDYRVKIDVDGKLKVYYTYDPAINLTFGNGWVDVGNSIAALNASDANIGVSLAGLEAQLLANKASFDDKINNLLQGLFQYQIISQAEYNNIKDYVASMATQTSQGARGSLEIILNNIRSAFISGSVSYIANAATNVNLAIAQNAAAAFFLGVGGIAFAAATGIVQNLAYLETISSQLNSNIEINQNLTRELKDELISSNLVEDTYNIMSICSNISNMTLAQGYINSNILIQQTIPSLKTSSLSLNSGNITQLNTINGTTGIFGTISTTNNTNQSIPSKGNFGGIADNIIIKNGSSTTYPYSIGYETNALWVSAEDNINFYNKGVKTLTLTSDNNVIFNYGNVSGINTIDVNNLTISGKITQYGELLDNTYLTSNALYNLSYNYTAERQYPPKTFNTSTSEKSVSFLGSLVYNQTLILDNTGISYGEGQYELYSSSTYDIGVTTKDKLFNNNTSETINTPRWGINLYNSGTGNYQGNSTIDGVHYGSWFILRLPTPIILTRFRIYKNTAFTQNAPSLWKCFGSSDGIEFNELFQAHNFTRLTATDYNSGYYEKTLASSPPLYNYIGFSFDSLVGTSGATDLNFAEIQLFGKEILNNIIDSYIYTTSNVVKYLIRNEMPDVGKRKAFYVSIPNTAVYYDNTSTTTYYKYDLDLREYTKTQTIAYTSDLMRIFKIRFFYVPAYFGSYIDGEPYVSSYEIYMSYKNNPIFGRPETAGLNIYSVGFPENTKLNNILPNQLMLLRNVSGSFDYLTIVSRTAPCDVSVIIEDMLF